MEIANEIGIKTAVLEDRTRITQLLQQARYRHYHVDWILPVDWLGSEGFVVGERPLVSQGQKRSKISLAGCLAVIADPRPTAWVRVAAVAYRERPLPLLEAMLDYVQPALQASGVEQISWLAVETWPNELLPQLGFTKIEAMETYYSDRIDISGIVVRDVKIRPVRVEELPQLVAMEEAAFEPPWRHSLTALQQALPQTLSFEVVEGENGRLLGFQYSMRGQGEAAHLVRITIAPEAQGEGIGSALMASAMRGYQQEGLKHASLNTEVSNTVSHKLYKKFGFYPAGHPIPIWGKLL